MVEEQHLEILKQGVKVWNKWREENRQLKPDVTGGNLIYEDLSGINFSNMDFSYESLSSATLIGSRFNQAILEHTDLSDAFLCGAIFTNADLSCANLYGAVLVDSDLTGAKLSHATLKEADLQNATLKDADLSGAIFTDVEGMTVEQLSKAKTMYGAIDLDVKLLRQMTEKYPYLLKDPEKFVQ